MPLSLGITKPSMSLGMVPATPTKKWVLGARPRNEKSFITIVLESNRTTSREERPFLPVKDCTDLGLGIESFTFLSTKTLLYNALFFRSENTNIKKKISF